MTSVTWGQALHDRGIFYAPDYAINAGGLIRVAQEYAGYDDRLARDKVLLIHDTIAEIAERSRRQNRPPSQIADDMENAQTLTSLAFKRAFGPPPQPIADDRGCRQRRANVMVAGALPHFPQNPRPFVDNLILQMSWSAATNRVMPSSPNAQLAVLTPVAMVPRCLPAGEKTRTPPGPVANRLPA